MKKLFFLLFIFSISFAATECSSYWEKVDYCDPSELTCNTLSRKIDSTCLIENCVEWGEEYSCDTVKKRICKDVKSQCNCNCIKYSTATCKEYSDCSHIVSYLCNPREECAFWIFLCETKWDICEDCYPGYIEVECQGECIEEECEECITEQCEDTSVEECDTNIVCLRKEKKAEPCQKTVTEYFERRDKCEEHPAPEISSSLSPFDLHTYVGMNLSIPVTISSVHERFTVTINAPEYTEKHTFINYPDPTTITINLTVSTIPFSANITVTDLIDSESTTKRLIYLSSPAPKPQVTFSNFVDPIKPLAGDSNELVSDFLSFDLFAAGVSDAFTSLTNTTQLASLGFGLIVMLPLIALFGPSLMANPITYFAFLVILPIFLDILPLIHAFFEKDKEKRRELIKRFWKEVTLDSILSLAFGLVPFIARKSGVILSESSDYFKKIAGNFDPDDIVSFKRRLGRICDWCDSFLSKNNIELPESEVLDKVSGDKMGEYLVASKKIKLYLGSFLEAGLTGVHNFYEVVVHEYLHHAMFTAGKVGDEFLGRNKLLELADDWLGAVAKKFSKNGKSSIINEFFDVMNHKVALSIDWIDEAKYFEGWSERMLGNAEEVVFWYKLGYKNNDKLLAYSAEIKLMSKHVQNPVEQEKLNEIFNDMIEIIEKDDSLIDAFNFILEKYDKIFEEVSI